MDLIYNLNWTGVIIGMCAFLIIGLFHPLVIKGYYYFGLKCRYYFLTGGILFLAACVMVENIYLSCVLGVTAFSCFWSIKEVYDQKRRVERGWFPANPKARTQGMVQTEKIKLRK